MGVHIHISHPQAASQQVMDGQSRVVENAEPGGISRRGVMQAAGNGKGNIPPAVCYQFSGGQGSPGTKASGVIHSRIDRIVAQSAETEPLRAGQVQPGAEAADRRHIFRGMHPLQFLLGSGPRVNQPGSVAVKSAIGRQQFVGMAQARRAHGMVGPQRMAGKGIGINKGGPGHQKSPPPIPQSNGMGMGWDNGNGISPGKATGGSGIR